MLKSVLRFEELQKFLQKKQTRLQRVRHDGIKWVIKGRLNNIAEVLTNSFKPVPNNKADESAINLSNLGPRIKNLKLMIFSTCQAEHLVEAAPKFGHSADHHLYQSKIGFDFPSIDLSKYDAIIIGFTLRHIINGAYFEQPDTMFAQENWSDELAKEVLDRAETLIENQLDIFQDNLESKPTFVMSFFEPSVQPMGHLLCAAGLENPTIFLRELNYRLARLLSKKQNFYYLDANEGLNAVGRLNLQDDAEVYTTHASILNDWARRLERKIITSSKFASSGFVDKTHLFQMWLFNRIEDSLKILRQANQVKLMVLDLDGTLWRGVAADDSMSAFDRTEGWPIGVVEALLYFKRRGGLLAICSKNDYKETEKRFEAIWGNRIKFSDFVSIKINWNPKSSNISEILAETNLLPGNVLFIDDNPREIDEVKSVYPEIRCLSGDPKEWRRVILFSPETQVAYVSEESKKRSELVRARIKREETLTSKTVVNRDEWLKSLEIEMNFSLLESVESDNFQRALELVNKTNQFNTTGQRWTVESFKSFFQDGGYCLVSSLKDKTIDNGIIGLVFLKRGQILQAVLSCRVFGLGAEKAMGALAIALALEKADSVSGKIVDTGRNFTCHNYFTSLGFSTVQHNEFETTQIPNCPDWIKIQRNIPVPIYK